MDFALPQPAHPPSSASPPTAPAVEVGYICGFWSRVIALLLDLVVLFLFLALPAIRWFHYFSSRPAAALALGFLVTFPYFIILNSRIGNGQTLGKRLAKIRVAGVHGDPISLQRSTLRCCALVTPFFLDNVQFNCSGGVCALTTSVTWLLGAWEFAIAYLYIFNRRTRQSLHDLAAETYIIDADLWPLRHAKPTLTSADPLAGWFASQVVTREQIWTRHFTIVGAIVLIFGLGSMFAARKVEEMEPFPDLLALQNAIMQSGAVRSAGVMIKNAWTNGRTNTSIVVTVTPSNALTDDATQPKEIAAIALNADPKTSEMDSLDIVILHTLNFGLVHFSYNLPFRHSPDEWRKLLGRPAPGNISL
jgi:uncharacterized RDD family membrane protein YckC